MIARSDENMAELLITAKEVMFFVVGVLILASSVVVCACCPKHRRKDEDSGGTSLTVATPASPTVIQSDYYQYHPKDKNAGHRKKVESIEHDRGKDAGVKIQKQGIPVVGKAVDLSRGRLLSSTSLNAEGEFAAHSDPRYRTLSMDIDDPFSPAKSLSSREKKVKCSCGSQAMHV